MFGITEKVNKQLGNAEDVNFTARKFVEHHSNDFAHKLSLSLWHEERVSSFLDMLGMWREVCSPAKHQETIKIVSQLVLICVCGCANGSSVGQVRRGREALLTELLVGGADYWFSGVSLLTITQLGLNGEACSGL